MTMWFSPSLHEQNHFSSTRTSSKRVLNLGCGGPRRVGVVAFRSIFWQSVLQSGLLILFSKLGLESIGVAPECRAFLFWDTHEGWLGCLWLGGKHPCSSFVGKWHVFCFCLQLISVMLALVGVECTVWDVLVKQDVVDVFFIIVIIFSWWNFWIDLLLQTHACASVNGKTRDNGGECTIWRSPLTGQSCQHWADSLLVCHCYPLLLNQRHVIAIAHLDWICMSASNEARVNSGCDIAALICVWLACFWFHNMWCTHGSQSFLCTSVQGRPVKKELCSLCLELVQHPACCIAIWSEGAASKLGLAAGRQALVVLLVAQMCVFACCVLHELEPEANFLKWWDWPDFFLPKCMWCSNWHAHLMGCPMTKKEASSLIEFSTGFFSHSKTHLFLLWFYLDCDICILLGVVVFGICKTAMFRAMFMVSCTWQFCCVMKGENTELFSSAFVIDVLVMTQWHALNALWMPFPSSSLHSSTMIMAQMFSFVKQNWTQLSFAFFAMQTFAFGSCLVVLHEMFPCVFSTSAHCILFFVWKWMQQNWTLRPNVLFEWDWACCHGLRHTPKN